MTTHLHKKALKQLAKSGKKYTVEEVKQQIKELEAAE